MDLGPLQDPGDRCLGGVHLARRCIGEAPVMGTYNGLLYLLHSISHKGLCIYDSPGNPRKQTVIPKDK